MYSSSIHIFSRKGSTDAKSYTVCDAHHPQFTAHPFCARDSPCSGARRDSGGLIRSSLELIFVGRAFTARQAPREGAPYINSSERRLGA